MGLKHSEDWIFNLNIGNVMFLAQIDDDELDYPPDRCHELNKDAMLEKIVLICSCYFGAATELRFLSEDNIVKNKMITKSHADMWHAQSAFMAAYFLPANCPLTDHFISSYDKYHIQNRPKELEEIVSTVAPITQNEQDENTEKPKLMFKKRK